MEKVSKNFLKDSYFIKELKLCNIRLIDNARFPWVILIPKRKNISDLHNLRPKDQKILITEIVYVSKVMKKTFKAFNLNVEKIGNIVKQLHIHVIVRSKRDSAWPLSVWVVKKKSYSSKNLNQIINKLRKAIKEL
jgi:diadenosine tetraphosphate (Ap4A) HIT family hydrolase